MRIQYEILLLTFLVMSAGITAKAQELSADAAPVKKKSTLQVPERLRLSLSADAAPVKKKAALQVPKKLWLSLSAATYTAAALDMHATAAALEWFNKHPHYYAGPLETDPLARPFVKLPRPAYYACGFALATGVNWLGYRMSRSRRWRKVWWLPQSVSISANSWGYKTRRSN